MVYCICKPKFLLSFQMMIAYISMIFFLFSTLYLISELPRCQSLLKLRQQCNAWIHFITVFHRNNRGRNQRVLQSTTLAFQIGCLWTKMMGHTLSINPAMEGGTYKKMSLSLMKRFKIENQIKNRRRMRDHYSMKWNAWKREHKKLYLDLINVIDQQMNIF